MGANMMLTIGAILLFGTFLSTTNKLMIGNNQIASQNEYYIAGLSLAQSVIDEAKTKAFDEKTIGQDSMVARTSLTAPISLGKDGATEAVPATDVLRTTNPYSVRYPGYSSVVFDDLDDYNRYSRTVTTDRSGKTLTLAEGYRLISTVRYGVETNPDLVSAARTYCKVITVKVTSPFFRRLANSSGPDTLTLSYAFTY